MSEFENNQPPLPLPKLSAQRIFRHLAVCLTYSHLQPTRNRERRITNPIQLIAAAANIARRTCPPAGKPSNNAEQPPMLFQPHLQRLHRPPTQIATPDTPSGFERSTTYASHGSANPFIPHQTASRLPFKANNDPVNTLFAPLLVKTRFRLRVYGHLQALTTRPPKPRTHLPPTLRG